MDIIQILGLIIAMIGGGVVGYNSKNHWVSLGIFLVAMGVGVLGL